MNNNPSAGNKAGGLTTVLEKSLGGVTKAGTTNMVEVYEYAEPVTAKGFVFMDTPGYDPMTVTGQVAGGANLICFTTGRGSAFGFMPTPSLKLATNTALWKRQEEDMDINCGEIVEWHCDDRRDGRTDLSPDARLCVRPEVEKRTVRLWSERVRTLADFGDHMTDLATVSALKPACHNRRHMNLVQCQQGEKP